MMHANGSNSPRGGSDGRSTPSQTSTPHPQGTRSPDGTLSFQIASDFAESRIVQDRIIDAVQAENYSDNDLFAIKLALEEAMINAIKHGNRLDPTKSVKVTAKVTHEQVEITVEDEGAGFDRADVPDPTDPANLEKSSGRGILLIEAYMTSAEWSNRGRKLRMSKTRETQLAAG